MASDGAPTETVARDGARRGLRLRIGDACLEVVSDHEPLLDELEGAYGDCVVAGSIPETDVRCEARHLPDSRVLSLRFEGRGLPDLIEAARSPFRLLRHRQCYEEVTSPGSRWRRLVNRAAGDRLLIASDGQTALVDLDEAPPDFVTDFLIGVVQRVQPGVLFLHAASVGISGRGALLIGHGRSGKSTTALVLASRGHVFLGDDVAAVKLATCQVLPYPKSAGVREGVLTGSLDLRAVRQVPATGPDGVRRVLVRVGDLFPGAVGGPLTLDRVFILDRFASRAAASPYRPALGDLMRLRSTVTDATPAWGVSAGRDLMKFLTVLNLLSGLRCHLVEVGSPVDTARLIETVMEGS